MESFLDRMRWFNENLQLQVEDIELERRGKIIVHYFDTADVQGALLGMQDLYHERYGRVELNKTEFDGKRILIRSLLSSKRLGQVRLLPPHQDELISKLKRKFKHWTRSQWKEKVGDFISKVGLSPDRYLSPPTWADPKTLASLLEEDMEQAEKLFKVFQNLLPWHRRLGIWQRNELIHFEATKIDPALLVSPDFALLVRKLNMMPERKDLYINNFTDALAWTYLVYLVKQFNSESSHLVPRFYSPASKFSLQSILKPPSDDRRSGEKEKALLETLSANLECKSAIGSLSVVRDDDYYLFKVAFRSYSFSASSNGSVNDNADKDEKLINLYNQLKKLIPSNDSAENKEELPVESFNKLSYEGKPILEFITELQQLTFFKSDWLKDDMYQHLWQALNDVHEYLAAVDQMKETLQHQNYQEAVRLVIGDIEGKLEEKVQAFSLIPTFWKQLNNEIKNLQSRIYRESSAVDDYYRDFGLLRYSFPKEVRSKVKELLNGLCSGDEDERENSYVEFIEIYLGARFYERKDDTALMVATAILIALRMYRDVFELLRENELSHFSLKIAYAELLFNPGRIDNNCDQDRCWQKGRNIIEELRQLQASNLIPPQQAAEVCAGLAYLYYHAWLFQNNDALWRLPSDQHSTASKRWQDLIDSAITFASRAHTLLDNNSLQLKVYALNEYVFFLVEGGAEGRLAEIKANAELLAKYKREAHLWQFRCDDTLARFYHRLAVYARTQEEWEEHTNHALRLVDEARQRSDNDSEIESYYEILKIYKTRGFSRRKQ